MNRWLTSDVFELRAATSREVERALGEAAELLRADNPAPERVRKVDSELSKLLLEMDPFFIRWSHYMSPHLERARS